LIHALYYPKDVNGGSSAGSANKRHPERGVAIEGFLKFRHDLEGFLICAEQQLEIMVPGLERSPERLGIQRREVFLTLSDSKFLKASFE
jgi:hypothetical protein